jgi:hypothetical protein
LVEIGSAVVLFWQNTRVKSFLNTRASIALLIGLTVSLMHGDGAGFRGRCTKHGHALARRGDVRGLRSGETTQSNNPPAAAVDPAQSSDVFISYASQDSAVANGVVQALERQGLKCWIAPRDVVPGSLYADEIVGAINDAKVVVLVLSAHSVASPHVRSGLTSAHAACAACLDNI